GHTEQRPIRFATLEGEKKPAMIHRHPSDDIGSQRLARPHKLIDGYGHVGHSLKTACEFLRDIEARRLKQFGEWTVGADKINDERPAQLIADAFVCQKIAHVEKVARVLTV